jgi:hypothetical protein
MPDEHPDYICVMLLGSGYAAVHMRWIDNFDYQGYDVQQTGLGRYVKRSAAETEARIWAASDEIALRQS